MRRSLLTALWVAGCWSPTFPVGLACSDAGTCPPEQVCRQGVCRALDDLGPPDGASFDGGVDAPVAPGPDAAISAVALGVACGSGFPCPATTPICRSTDGVSSDGFCTITCAGVGDDAPCRNGYAQEDGVPSCLLTDGVSWYCSLLCGGGATAVEDGACPYELACNMQRDGDVPAEICGE